MPQPVGHVARMKAYTPGEQPPPGTRVVKLNTNEGACPPSSKIIEAIRGITAEQLRVYPDPTARVVREAAATRHGRAWLTPDHVVAGNGSDDILTLAVRTFVPAGGVVAAPWPTYSLYPTLCTIQGAWFVPVAWERRGGTRWALPVATLLEAVDAADASAVFVANPNAPSGTAADPDDLHRLAAALASRDRLLLIDEAYADFAETDCIDFVEAYPNVLVTRSLSKGFSAAGLRVGYGVSRPQLVRELAKVKDSYNLDAVSQLAAAAALTDVEHARVSHDAVRRERRRLTDGLGRLGFEVEPSVTNFVLARVPAGGPDASTIYEGLKERGVLVRYFRGMGIDDCLRITVGTGPQTDALLAVLHEVVPAPSPAGA